MPFDKKLEAPWFSTSKWKIMKDEVKRRGWMWSLWPKKKKKKKKTSHFMKGKLRLCFENGLARVLNQKYLDSKAWSDVLLLSDMGERKKKRKNEILRMVENRSQQQPKKWCLEDWSYMAESHLCQSKKRLKMDYTYNRMKPNRWKAYQGPPTTKTDWRTGSFCRTYMITFSPGEGCRVTQWWSLRSAVANLRLRWGWWWRQRGRWRLHKH